MLEHDGKPVVDVAIEELESAWRQALPKLLT